MPDLREIPDDFRPGARTLAARDLNLIKDALPRLITGTPGQISVQKLGDRIVIGLDKRDGSKPGALFQTFVVINEFADYLLCAIHTHDTEVDYHDSTPSGYETTFRVAKPRLLQQTPFDGQTVELDGLFVGYTYVGIGQRTAVDTNDEEVTENQVIVPAYFAGDIICARRGLTGYTYDSGDETNPLGLVEWTDMNEGGRQWAMVQEEE